MVASRRIQITLFGGIGGQRVRCFGGFAQVTGRIVILFMRKKIVAAAERVGVDMWEIVLLELADVVRGSKNFKTAAKIMRGQTLRKQLGSGSREKRVLPIKSAKQTSRLLRDFLINISH